TIAPPIPCTARAAISQSADGASAAKADAPVKSATPIMNKRLRPKRSPSAAPVSRNTANVRVYALTVHSSCSSDAPRSTRMTGRAVETTRLSSTTMKSAIEVIANVHRVLALAVIDPPQWIVTDYSHLREKREAASRCLVPAALGETCGPGVLRLVCERVLHRPEHVHEHPLSEEARDRVLVRAGDGLHVVDEPAVPARDRSPDVLVVHCRRVRLELSLEHDAIALDELAVRVADRIERILPGRAGCGRPEQVQSLLEAHVVDGQEEVLLGAEEAEEVGLGDACAT